MSERLWSWKPATRSKIGPTCPDCQTIHCGADVVAVGKFNPTGIEGYRPRLGGELRATRAEVVADVCRDRQERAFGKLPDPDVTRTMRAKTDPSDPTEGDAS